MNESNLYAPPQVTELEAHHDRCWKLQGHGLLVKNGVTLPKVDLESGVTGEQAPLELSKYSHQHLDFRFFISMAIAISCYGICKWLFPIDNRTAFLIMVSVTSLIGILISLSGRGNQPSTIWIFTEVRRRKRKIIRRNLRIAATIVLILPVFGISRIARTPDLQWLLFGFLVWVGLILALGIWSVCDNPKYKFKQFSPRWLSIAPLHPKATEYLQQLEFTELSALAQAESIPNRQVRTMYLYRFPLRMLLHTNRNPLIIIKIILMKYLRSLRLERLFYAESEATELSFDELSPTLRETCDRWFALHSDWIFVQASFLDSPLRDLQTETAAIASANLASTIIIRQTNLAITPRKFENQYSIVSWIDGGNRSISTYDCPYLSLKDPHLIHRAHGSPQDIYEEHLRNFSGYSIYCPSNITELRDLLHHRLLEINSLLEDKKIQSPVVEYSRQA